MSKRPTTRSETQPSDEYREITIEVHEDVARRLEASAARYSRYRSAGDVAAECVHLYLELLEAADGATERLMKRQISRHLRQTSKAPAKRARLKGAVPSDRSRDQAEPH